MNDKNLIIGSLAVIVIIGAILYAVSGKGDTPTPIVTPQGTTEVGSGPQLALAQCLKDSGTIFYGAFWCSHCKKQKQDFGSAVPALPYVECSTPDGNDQTPLCKAKGIKSYPTWRFADGSELTGEQSLETLAQKSNCTQALPGALPAASTTAVSSSSRATAP